MMVSCMSKRHYCYVVEMEGEWASTENRGGYNYTKLIFKNFKTDSVFSVFFLRALTAFECVIYI